MRAIASTAFLSAALLAICPAAEAADKPVSLKEAFKDYFLVGTAVNRSMVTGGTTVRRSAEQNDNDVALIKEQVNQIPPENDPKWQLIHPHDGKERYDLPAA